MKKNYNYKRQKLFLPEYGRHIQEMVDSLLLIEDRRERNRQARAVIAVMGNLNPLLRDTADFTHKLWDHMFIMSDFKLDVDSPYPPVTRESLTIRPKKMRYPSNQVMYKHYGKNNYFEGRDNNGWIVLDYSSVIVHIFSRENRDFYQLEKLYGDAEDVTFVGIDDKIGEEQ